MMNNFGTGSVWSKFRADIDLDDLIFNYEAYHKHENDDSRSYRSDR